MLMPIGLSFALLAAPPPAALAAAPTAAPTLLRHPLEVEHLDNGFTWVLVPFESPGVVAYFTLVRAGSRDEVEPGKSGYAHLFEHLMFRGTEKMSAKEYDEHLQALGVDNTAYTSTDCTLYEPSGPTESLPELASIEADRFAHLSYTRAAYKDETGAVLGEYNKDASDPLMPMQEALGALAFTRHTYGHTTLGWKRDVVAMPGAYDYSRSFFKRFYTPDDCTLFVVGDFDAAKVAQIVHREYSAWVGKRAVTHVADEPEQTTPRARAITWKDATSPRLLEGFRVPAAGANLTETAALAVAASLAVGESSELYQRLVVKEQKLLELRFDPDDALSRDPGLLQLYAKLKESTAFDDVIGAVGDAFARVGRGETSPAAVDAVRRHLANAQVLALQTPQSVAGGLARWAALTGDPRSLQAYATALAAVTPDEVARVARTYLVPARRNVVTLTTAPVSSTPAAPAAKKAHAR